MATSDAREVEWQFDAVDLRPVVRWLEAPDGVAGAEFTAAAAMIVLLGRRGLVTRLGRLEAPH